MSAQLKEALVQTQTRSKEQLERQDTNKTKAFELKQDIGTMLYDGKTRHHTLLKSKFHPQSESLYFTWLRS